MGTLALVVVVSRDVLAGRDDRNVRLLGAEGQRRLASSRIGIAGLGGLGSVVAQQLAYLGVLDFVLMDGDLADTTSLNRLVSAVPGDEGILKVELAERMIRGIQPGATVAAVGRYLTAGDVAEFRGCDLIVGCLDGDLARSFLLAIASDLRVPYVDAASDVPDVPGRAGSPVFGGRVVTSGIGHGCLSCRAELDQDAMRRQRLSGAEREAYDRQYGIDGRLLDAPGPSVVTLNSVVASLAATEIMCVLTGLRDAAPHLEYRGDLATVRPRVLDLPDCWYCTFWARAD